MVVVEVEFEGAWQAAGEVVLAFDARGIALVTSVPGWRFGELRFIDL